MEPKSPPPLPLYVIMTADVTAAYVSNNKVAIGELRGLIEMVHTALTNISPNTAPAVAVVHQMPAVSPKKSIQSDFLICLEDGKKLKLLKRHLRSKYDMSPDQYRAKWGLPGDYPMIAPNYAEQRSKFAKAAGLGREGKRGRGAAKKATP